MKPVFTTVRPLPHAPPAELAAGGAVVLQKPFPSVAVAQAVAAQLGWPAE